MTKKMLIDASHEEETRVVVLSGNSIEEFDFESENKKQLKGNIYLARVTRVEPSLQAAFVEYGQNRHGFLAFSEIHPDYYQIPIADRQKIVTQPNATDLPLSAEAEKNSENSAQENNGKEENSKKRKRKRPPKSLAEKIEKESVVEELNKEETSEDYSVEKKKNDKTFSKSYKIQEVIKRTQILLVQVVKEERGLKGAGMTTYLSLAGRYSVLMPNTPRGGGVSKKITNVQDRQRLKDVMKDLEIPEGMGVILRTAGENRTKTEIKRDYESLIRLWDNIRSLTLKSNAPCLVHEEGNLVKRSIRDLYKKEITEILVAGEKAYREAKDFMRMLVPSHAKIVQRYRNPTPIFAFTKIEKLLEEMMQPNVALPSGGHIVINHTEALVAIDVNSGRSTREHSIENTALQTNLEAAEKIAHQLRLRDLAGLIVIDFIDMEDVTNKRLVEKKIKESLKNDRARIQIGRISNFGLLEMSRQRIRASIFESTMKLCPQCNGTGHIKPESSVALLVLRSIEEFLIANDRNHIIVKTSPRTAFYILNYKRDNLFTLEKRFGLSISFEPDESLGLQNLLIVKGKIVDKAHNEDVVSTIEPMQETIDKLVEPTKSTPAVEGNIDDATQQKKYPKSKNFQNRWRKKENKNKRLNVEANNRDGDSFTQTSEPDSSTNNQEKDQPSQEQENIVSSAAPNALKAPAKKNNFHRKRNAKRYKNKNGEEKEFKEEKSTPDIQEQKEQKDSNTKKSNHHKPNMPEKNLAPNVSSEATIVKNSEPPLIEKETIIPRKGWWQKKK